jgi:hypothetical protein
MRLNITSVVFAMTFIAAALPVVALPAIASTVSGKVYRLDPNSLAIATIRLDFDKSAEAKVFIAFSDGQPQRNGAVGLDGIYRMSPGEAGIPAGIRGSWKDANTFHVEYDAITYLDAFDLTMRFGGSKIVIDAKERTYETGVTLTGTSAGFQ